MSGPGPLISAFSLISRAVCRIKNLLYDRKILRPEKASIFVISIGNISLGGTEKTPLAMNLLSFLLRDGWKAALVSRGYKGKWERKGGILSDGRQISGSWEEGGDEPFMIARNVPEAGVFIGKNRLHSCRRAGGLGFEIAVLDDGFQHRRLHRDVDIVLINPSEKSAMRENSFSVERAHIILVREERKDPDIESWKSRFPDIPVFEYSVITEGFLKPGGGDLLPPDFLTGKKVLAFCGIARPERFARLLERNGARIACFLRFPDHHAYPPTTLKRILDGFSRFKPEAAVTTEKDAVKLTGEKDLSNRIPLYTLRIGLEVEKGFYDRVSAILQSRRGGH